MHLVVAYDVIDDSRRTRLAKFLLAYLDRVQKSVFEGEIQEGRLNRMRNGIEEIIDQDENSVRIYHLCARCIGAVDLIGTGEYIDAAEDDVII
jgi:CRISPR-associated protein Cas2